MGKLVPALAIAGGAMSLLTALVLVPDTPAPLLGVLFGLVAGLLIALRPGLPFRVGGGLGIAMALIGLLGVIGTFSTGGDPGQQSRTLDFGVSGTVGLAFTFASCLAPAGALIWSRWGTAVSWVDFALAGALGLAVILALVFHGHLNDQSSGIGYLAGLLGLGGALAAGVLALREA